jgi:eukaryotic-like serine/threonine-protein kinase
MSLDRWQQVKAMFSSALDHPPAERQRFLEQACGQDTQLLEEVRSLLIYEQSTQTTASRSASASGEPASAILGQCLGPYQLVREIGRGGMASVYMAIRTDDQYRKRVAIKVVNRVLGSEEVVRRFLGERQTLAVLDHLNIVKLLDGGTSTDGLIYLVMDYVEGMSITEYSDAHRLTIRERLELFRTICGAVHYAHQNLVIHRDLKPANILVSAAGTPKLLDFGIAKLLNPEFLEEAWMTRSALHPMTPEYASPEQIRGEAVTTATDIYSLGVVLYELLTGRMPYSATPFALSQMEKIVCNEQPRVPSTIVTLSDETISFKSGGQTGVSVNVLRGEPTAVKLSRRLAGDLDNIVLMALRKEPQHRYSSAEQLSEDLRRHLDGLPVVARKPTLRYRSGKFVHRNLPWVIVAGVIVALLVAAVLITSREARIARSERWQAEQRFNDVHELADSFLFEFDDSIKHLRGSTPARELLVRKALEYLNRLEIESRGDASLQLDLIRAYLKVGDIQGSPYTANLGDLKGALETYNKGQQIALVLFRSHPHDRNVQLLLAKTYGNIGAAQVFAGSPQDAVINLNQAVGLLRPITLSPDPSVEAELVLINSYTELGDAYGHGSVVNLGQPRKALEFFQDFEPECADLSSRKHKSARRPCDRGNQDRGRSVGRKRIEWSGRAPSQRVEGIHSNRFVRNRECDGKARSCCCREPLGPESLAAG